MNKEIQLIAKEIDIINKILKNLLINILPSFNITDEKILPYGLKAHTRSVSWLVEQVITQQLKYNAKKLNINDVDINIPDTCLHDCIIIADKIKYYVNIKIHNINGKENKNDIAALEKLFTQYTANIEYRLIYACFGIKFDNINISFDKTALHLFSPQFLPIYVNPRNDKIQALYKHKPIERTRKEFLELLKSESKSIIL